jgi:hypothetical protein
MIDEQVVANMRYALACDMHRPSHKFIGHIRLSIDGNQWCALLGENLQDGVAGFGVSPEMALSDFDRAFAAPLREARREP